MRDNLVKTCIQDTVEDLFIVRQTEDLLRRQYPLATSITGRFQIFRSFRLRFLFFILVIGFRSSISPLRQKIMFSVVMGLIRF
ncbi:MAG: hypothetical protein CL607_17960 [Anaerolineaceae bacterium]|nr:hypothetical protein [Anaerolineaceae bacterium]MAU11715.1 hypothetical protein [Anaerolineaceae bacterium]